VTVRRVETRQRPGPRDCPGGLAGPWRGLAVAIIAFTACAPLAAQPNDATCSSAGHWAGLINDHVQRYPGLELADLYKALHQGALGSEHEVSRGGARSWLDREIASLQEGPSEALVERLGEEGRFARVHLRPFLAAGGDSERLLEAFVATANAETDGTSELECALGIAAALGATGRLPWPAEAVARYASERAAEGFPAVHHSEGFESAYHPAYRVISVERLPDALRGARFDEDRG